MKKCNFIVVDGIDGSGKSEIVKMLHNYLNSKSKKYRILATREPTNGIFGRQIRKMLRHDKDPGSNRKILLELFIKDRRDHIQNTIYPFLNKPNEHKMNIVLCDRYYYSTIAFQGAQGLDMKLLVESNNSFRKPDISFILDIDPSLALKRIEFRQKEKFEQLEFMKRIRENFLKLPKMMEDDIKIIDASKTLNKVFENVRKEVDKIIKK